jgi:hypothetical protein
MIELPKNPPENTYIDRPDYYAEILNLIQTGAPKHLVLGDTHAIYGTGKTTALARLYYDLKAKGEQDPIWLALENYSLSHTNEKISDFGSLEALKLNLDDYKRLLVQLGNQIDPQAFDRLPEQLEKITGEAFDNLFRFDISAKGGSVDVGALAKVAGSDLQGGNVKIDLNLDNQEAILRYALETRVTSLGEAFIDVFTPIAKKRHFVLFADDFCWIIDQKIGDWFLNLAERMDNTVVLISRTITGNQLKWNADQMLQLHLPLFSNADVKDYLFKRGIVLNQEQLSKVYRYSKLGHPLLVSLAGDLLERLVRRGFQDLDRILDRLLDGSGDQQVDMEIVDDLDELSRSIDQIAAELRDDIMKYDHSLLLGLDVIALARRFDYDLIRYVYAQMLIDRGESDPQKAEEIAQEIAHGLIQRLPRYSVVEEYNFPEAQESYYRLHYLVRERMEANLQRSEPPEHLQHIQMHLAEYYAHKENTNMHGMAEYSRMFRMQNSAWQNDMLEWLYHLFRLQAREQAQLELTRIFLEAFDWWGFYLDFAFCRDLLDNWKSTQPSDDQEVVDLLRDFQAAYPLGFQKRQQGDWVVVKKSLQNVIARLKLNLPKEKMSHSQRMVAGQVHRFIAEAYRFYKQPDYARSDEYYQASLDYFDTDWNRFWITSYRADVNLEWGQQLEQLGKAGEAAGAFARVEPYARQSNQMAFQEENYLEQDHELISQNFRILGQLYQHQQQWDKMQPAFLRAIAHAYIFHFMEDNQDKYSYQLYCDTGDVILKSLAGMAQAGAQDPAVKTCQSLRQFWFDNSPFSADQIMLPVPAGFDLAAALAGADLSALRAYVFPVLPAVGDESGAIQTGVEVCQDIVGQVQAS